MIISHKHKFIFFCNGKTGTTSVEKILEPLQEGEEFNKLKIKGIYLNRHIPPAIVKACLPQNIWDSYFKFTFVRNPWDWFVSSWKYYFAGCIRRVQFLHLLRHPRDAMSILSKFDYNYRKLYQMNDKKIFTCEDINFYFNYSKKHFGIPPYSGKFQYHYVFDVDGDQIVDFFGRFEQLEQDFKIMVQEKLNLDLDLQLPHLNYTNRSNYQKYFTEETKQQVAKLWHKDIQLFGYSFD